MTKITREKRNFDHEAARFGLSDAGNIYGRLTNQLRMYLKSV